MSFEPAAPIQETCKSPGQETQWNFAFAINAITPIRFACCLFIVTINPIRRTELYATHNFLSFVDLNHSTHELLLVTMPNHLSSFLLLFTFVTTISEWDHLSLLHFPKWKLLMETSDLGGSYYCRGTLNLECFHCASFIFTIKCYVTVWWSI